MQVSELGIEAKTLSGHDVSFAWDDVARVEQLPRYWRTRGFRIVLHDGKDIVIIDELSEFPELTQSLRDRAKGADWRSRRHWWGGASAS